LDDVDDPVRVRSDDAMDTPVTVGDKLQLTVQGALFRWEMKSL
jgi:hypothetical protein